MQVGIKSIKRAIHYMIKSSSNENLLFIILMKNFEKYVLLSEK